MAQLKPIQSSAQEEPVPPTMVIKAQPEPAVPPTMAVHRRSAEPPVPPTVRHPVVAGDGASPSSGPGRRAAEHQPPPPEPARPPAGAVDKLAALEREHDQLLKEVAQLRQENARLKEQAGDAKRAPDKSRGAAAPEGQLEGVRNEALTTLKLFGDSLEQASAALRAGDISQARALLRDASPRSRKPVRPVSVARARSGRELPE